MTLTKTPVCDFGKKAVHFKLKSTNNKLVSLNDIKGENGTLIMFICNHCPYVKAIIKELINDCKMLQKKGISTVAIMSNDTINYKEDSFENMIKFARDNGFKNIDYLIDQTQEVAKQYEAVCTPDFFGFNRDLKLQYRGRFKEIKNLKPNKNDESDLKTAMQIISLTQVGPYEQIPSMGCNIKWFK